MKGNLKLQTKLSKLKNTSGSSYIEFVIMVPFYIMLVYILMQLFMVVHAQIIMMDTARYALKQVEQRGMVPAYLQGDVEDSLKKIKNIEPGTVKVTVTDQNGNVKSKFQIRESIKLNISVQYNLVPSYGPKLPIKMSSTYTGSSKWFFKDPGMPYTPITEN